MTKSSRILLFSTAVLVLGIAGPASTLAKGPPIKVEQAVPNFAIQKDMGVPITLKGRNFPEEAAVVFILNKAGDSNDGSETQVVVSESSTVTLNSAGDLVFEIDVASEAILGDYDIEVIELSAGGRKGKGTTLFSVQSKDGGGTGSTLAAAFCLIMMAENSGLASDGERASNGFDYCDDRKERVLIGTGSHPGFRFDSNSKSRPPKRWVHVDVPGGPVDVEDDSSNFLSSFATGDYQIDLRFNKGDGGLDLGSMKVGSVGFVPVNVWLESLDDDSHSPDGNRFGLAYSANTDPLNDGRLAGSPCIRDNTILDAKVTRLDAGEWQIESSGDAIACLWDLNADLSKQTTGTLVQMPFLVVIEIK